MYAGRPNPARTVSHKAFDVSDFSITVHPTGLYIKPALGKTGRGAGVGAGDQWVKSGDGNWEIYRIFRNCLVHLRELARDLHT